MDNLLANVRLSRPSHVLLGVEDLDDAGVVRLEGDVALVQTLDFITPVCDDPYLFGQIAAANSLSDVYATGGKPITAMNICCFPAQDIPAADLEAILAGGISKIEEAGAVLVGGHTVRDRELKYGLAVTGLVNPTRFWSKKGARPNDVLILTKPIGTGILIGALREGAVSPADFSEVAAGMAMLNRRSAELMSAFEVHACTDITGYGLLGHASEMLRAGDIGFRIHSEQIPFYSDARQLTSGGSLSSAAMRNRMRVQPYVRTGGWPNSQMEALLYDPQTSGGLLAAVAADNAEALLELLRAEATTSAIIGEVVESNGPGIFVE